RGAVDQHLLTGLQLALVTQRLQRSQRRDRHRRRLLEAHIRGLQRYGARLAYRHVLAEGAELATEHLIPRLEARHLRAHRFDRAGEIDTQARVVRAAETAFEPHEVWFAAHVVPVERVHGGCVYVYQHFVVSRCGPGEGLELQNLGRTVTAVSDGAHGG